MEVYDSLKKPKHIYKEFIDNRALLGRKSYCITRKAKSETEGGL